MYILVKIYIYICSYVDYVCIVFTYTRMYVYADHNIIHLISGYL